MTGEEIKVITASSAGTIFEWYDFYLYGSLAAVIGAKFFSSFDVNTRAIFALLAFAAGFLVRPFGALFFGRLGDLIGRKATFLITILIMGVSTFLVGLLPDYNTIGWVAPVLLIALRMAQGLALGGEYGGAAVYVAEHSPAGRRGFYTSWIQTTATLGLLLSLFVIVGLRLWMGEEAFQDTGGKGYDLGFLGLKGGWRIPFLASIILLVISVIIRLTLNESPAFKKIKEEGTASKAPLIGSLRSLAPGLRRPAGGDRPRRHRCRLSRLRLLGAARHSRDHPADRRQHVAHRQRPHRHPGPDGPGRRAGGRLVHGPVLRAVLPRQHPQGGSVDGELAGCLVADHRHAVLPGVWRIVRPHRPAQRHPRRLPARGGRPISRCSTG